MDKPVHIEPPTRSTGKSARIAGHIIVWTLTVGTVSVVAGVVALIWRGVFG